jgi:hypothetical protein
MNRGDILLLNQIDEETFVISSEIQTLAEEILERGFFLPQ